MLGVRTYERTYVDACRAKIAADLAAYRGVAHAPGSDAVASSAFEPVFFNNMVLVLEQLFVHRLRTVEGKDGNPLNEVRMICNSIMLNNGAFTADSAIKFVSERSILKLQFGDEISIDEDEFTALSNAFFAEIERKFA